MNKEHNQSEAQLIDGCLVISCPHAVQPIIWRMEVEKIGTASFEVKVNEKDNTAKLVLKPKKGTAELVANFTSKEEAVDALVATSSALQSRDGISTKTKKSKKENAKVDSIQEVHGTKQSSHKWLISIMGLLLVVLLYLYMASLVPEKIQLEGSENIPLNNSSASSTSQQTTGVPVSADDFLKGL